MSLQVFKTATYSLMHLTVAMTVAFLLTGSWHAALAIEHGCDWLSTDGDFSRFPGLKWRHPLG